MANRVHVFLNADLVQLYLTPKTARVGDNVKRFANPTPIGLLGYDYNAKIDRLRLMSGAAS